MGDYKPYNNSVDQYGVGNETAASDPRTKLYTRFKAGLKKKYDMTIDNLIELDFFCIGEVKNEDAVCVCDVKIVNQYLCRSYFSPIELTIGSCCAKHFLSHGIRKRHHCKDCGIITNNYKTLFCTECKTCNELIKKAVRKEMKILQAKEEQEQQRQEAERRRNAERERELANWKLEFEAQKAEREKRDREHILKTITEEMTHTFELMIPFDEKDDIKKLGYTLAYNDGKWFYTGTDLPEPLKSYLCVAINIPFMSKDNYKKIISYLSEQLKKNLAM